MKAELFGTGTGYDYNQIRSELLFPTKGKNGAFQDHAF